MSPRSRRQLAETYDRGPSLTNFPTWTRWINMTKIQWLALGWVSGVKRHDLECLDQAASRFEFRRLEFLAMIFASGESEEDATWAALWRTFLLLLSSLNNLAAEHRKASIGAPVFEKYRPFRRDVFFKRSESKIRPSECETKPSKSLYCSNVRENSN
jgi:hypothetical protein